MLIHVPAVVISSPAHKWGHPAPFITLGRSTGARISSLCPDSADNCETGLLRRAPESSREAALQPPRRGIRATLFFLLREGSLLMKCRYKINSQSGKRALICREKENMIILNHSLFYCPNLL